MKLNELAPKEGARHRKKRRGCGIGSGHGKTATRGTKGQKARSGRKPRRGFEGGQMPLYRRMPKRGFVNPFKNKKKFAILNLSQLNKFPKDTEVTPSKLVEVGLIKTLRQKIKILGEGSLRTPLKITAHGFSKSAREKIKETGGEVKVLE
jgi:large subunit ribosomal protein L15